MTITVKFDRTDEAGFRTGVPRALNGCPILEVAGFRPGGPGHYARATALVGIAPDGYCTHRVYCMDDFPDGELRWCLEAGHYFTGSGNVNDNRRAAEADFLHRAYDILPLAQ